MVAIMDSVLHSGSLAHHTNVCECALKSAICNADSSEVNDICTLCSHRKNFDQGCVSWLCINNSVAVAFQIIYQEMNDLLSAALIIITELLVGT